MTIELPISDTISPKRTRKTIAIRGHHLRVLPDIFNYPEKRYREVVEKLVGDDEISPQYIGTTALEKEKYILTATRSFRQLRNAPLDTPVRISAELDPLCYACIASTHCPPSEMSIKDDNDTTMQFLRVVRRNPSLRVGETTMEREPHPLVPAFEQIVVYTTAGTVKNYLRRICYSPKK